MRNLLVGVLPPLCAPSSSQALRTLLPLRPISLPSSHTHAHDCDRKTGRSRGFWHRLVSGCAMCRCGCGFRAKCSGRGQRVPWQVVRAGVRSEPRKWNTRTVSLPSCSPSLPCTAQIDRLSFIGLVWHHTAARARLLGPYSDGSYHSTFLSRVSSPVALRLQIDYRLLFPPLHKVTFALPFSGHTALLLSFPSPPSTHPSTTFFISVASCTYFCCVLYSPLPDPQYLHRTHPIQKAQHPRFC
ncbi:hypothetical protein DFH06DRAFT_577418 [Mycena polygramma]|nr:hypothetical protein DFH06DRAFT_577418 [Mycena polygramma]